MFEHQAIQVLTNSVHEKGFLASATAEENYGRIWSRDSAITAVAVLLHQQTQLYPVIKKSILTLAGQQKANGIIPSNVGFGPGGEPHVSYGTLVGRVDAQTWWIIQSCLYIKQTKDTELAEFLNPKINQTLELLEAWEFNGRHLVYTPLGGNWADEYILAGYTFYDNLLRYLALLLCAQVWPENECYIQKARHVKDALNVNFTNAVTPNTFLIHQRAKHKWQEAKRPYFPAAFDAAQYITQWDAAANGLALLLGFEKKDLFPFISELLHDPKIGYVPAFWPPIFSTDSEWGLLRDQYNYHFKNEPYHFHNGGSWPVMSGILSLGLTLRAEYKLASQIKDGYESFLTEKDELLFSEYIAMDQQLPGGKKALCFSAAGYLMMKADSQQIKSLFGL